MFRMAVFAIVVTATSAWPVAAADPNAVGYVHIGVSYARQADEATLYAYDMPLPGAAFTTEGKLTLGAELGLFVADGFALAVSGILPTTTPNIAAGTLAGIGNLGDETVGFYSATVQHHFGLGDITTPYVGAGLGYMHVFNMSDGVATDLSVESAFGGVIQVGVDLAVTDSVGLFIDAKRFFLSTEARGNLFGTPVNAMARVDPWVVSSGLSVRF